MTVPDRLGACSPLLLILVGHCVEQVTSSVLGAWTWVPAMLAFWTAIALLVKSLGSADGPRRWFRAPGSRSIWCWLSVGVGLLGLPGFLAHWRIVASPAVLVLWLAFALINPLFEETYWRGFVLDATSSWPPAISVAYSAVLFAVSHPLIWGVHSAALRDWKVVPVLAVIGFIWAMAYRRTGSVWCSVIGHALCNLLGMSVPVLMNIYSPAP